MIGRNERLPFRRRTNALTWVIACSGSTDPEGAPVILCACESESKKEHTSPD